MNTVQDIRTRRIIFALVLLAIGVIMLLLNCHTPLLMDDYDYSFSWSTGERLTGVRDILASQAAHYMLWGGRSVVHFLAQLFLYLGKPVFNLFNTLMYLLLLLEIVCLAQRKDTPWDWRIVLGSHLLLFFAVPFFGVVFLWLDGACNYLWGTVLALLPLVIARSERENGFFDAGFSRGVIALPVCFIAGWTNENTACGVLAVWVLLLLFDMFRGRRIRFWRVAAAVCLALGTALMLLAPGNFARAGEASARGFVMEMLYRAAVVSYCMLRYAGVPLALCLVVFFCVRRKGIAVCYEWLCTLLVCAVLCAYALVGSPQISDRSFTAVTVLCIAALMALVARWPFYGGKTEAAAAVLLFIAAAAGGVSALEEVRTHEAAWLAQVERIETAKREGEEEAVVSSVFSDSRFTMSMVLQKDPQQWPNSTLERYYGVQITGE